MMEREQHLGETHRLLEAAGEFLAKLRHEREVPLSFVTHLAKFHNVNPVDLLAQVEMSPDCDTDLDNGVVRCQK